MSHILLDQLIRARQITYIHAYKMTAGFSFEAMGATRDIKGS